MQEIHSRTGNAISSSCLSCSRKAKCTLTWVSVNVCSGDGGKSGVAVLAGEWQEVFSRERSWSVTCCMLASVSLAQQAPQRHGSGHKPRVL